MNADLLHVELARRGLSLLAVVEHPHNPGVAVVYLHGAAGQWVNGWALQRAWDVPGVHHVAESAQTPAIILVWMEPDPPRPARSPGSI